MQGMPVPSDMHKRLHVLAGSWVGEEQLAPSPWGPGGPAVGRTEAVVTCNGFFVAHDYAEEKDGQVTFRGHGIFGYDTQTQRVAWIWVDSMGEVPTAPSWGAWDGDRLQLVSQSPRGQGRYTYEFDGPDRYRFTLENSFDGGKTWVQFMTGTYRRLTSSA